MARGGNPYGRSEPNPAPPTMDDMRSWLAYQHNKVLRRATAENEAYRRKKSPENLRDLRAATHELTAIKGLLDIMDTLMGDHSYNHSKRPLPEMEDGSGSVL